MNHGPDEPGVARARTDMAASRCLPLMVALVTFLVFSRVLRHELVDWDDNILVTNNPAFRGLTWTHLRWMFTTTLLTHYAPLTWLTLALDHAVWGTNPLGYHLTNLVLHAVNAALVYLLAWRLLGLARLDATGWPLRIGSATAALVFALHPLRVESVAWITERRGLLAGLFSLATVLLYLAAASAPSSRRRVLLATSTLCYALALVSKASVMTLPLVLVVLDWYPLRRLGRRQPVARHVWLEKIPYAVLSMLTVVSAYRAGVAEGTMLSFARYPWASRLAMAANSLWFYTVKTVIPVGLSPLYELPPHLDLLEPQFIAAYAGVVGMTAVLVLMRSRWPAALAGWIAYGLLLAPVAGLVHTGVQLVADRYSYLPTLGAALVVGGVVARRVQVWATHPAGGRLAPPALVAAGLALTLLATLTWRQVQVWRNTGTLFSHALAVEADCAICHGNLGVWLIQHGSVVDGVAHIERGATLRPDHYMALGRLGWAYAQVGRLPESIEALRRERRRLPQAVDVRNLLAELLIEAGRPSEAVEELRDALRLAPDDPRTQANLARALRALEPR